MSNLPERRVECTPPYAHTHTHSHTDTWLPTLCGAKADIRRPRYSSITHKHKQHDRYHEKWVLLSRVGGGVQLGPEKVHTKSERTITARPSRTVRKLIYPSWPVLSRGPGWNESAGKRTSRPRPAAATTAQRRACIMLAPEGDQLPARATSQLPKWKHVIDRASDRKLVRYVEWSISYSIFSTIYFLRPRSVKKVRGTLSTAHSNTSTQTMVPSGRFTVDLFAVDRYAKWPWNGHSHIGATVFLPFWTWIWMELGATKAKEGRKRTRDSSDRQRESAVKCRKIPKLPHAFLVRVNDLLKLWAMLRNVEIVAIRCGRKTRRPSLTLDWWIGKWPTWAEEAAMPHTLPPRKSGNLPKHSCAYIKWGELVRTRGKFDSVNQLENLPLHAHKVALA